MERFKELKFDRKKIIKVEGMEISAYIAGVNSGVYSFPFIITVRCWARRFFFRKFFVKQARLQIGEIRQLRDELDKVIRIYESGGISEY